MTTEIGHMMVGGLRVDVVRKAIKNLHIGVYPPNGRVRVAAPLAVNDDAVRLAVVTRLGWIKRQKAKFEEQTRQSERVYVSGESHYFLGQRYRLRVIEAASAGRVVIRNGNMIELQIRPQTDQAGRERLMLAWYRQQLRARAAPMIMSWVDTMALRPPAWGIKRMKTKWGTCNIEAQRIWLNLELIKKPAHCLEYVVVHELAHFRERNHTDRFIELMDQHLPSWRSVREELNTAPLAHETWE
ncbi:M48 family metallopeptidase [Acidiphilium sp.]|uniref:M48 family metallopeptidase n=1 Tax=Acidiphilium sp. TaxID=527 RepID=UPI003D08672D